MRAEAFPDIEVPDELGLIGFKDTSWGNDAGAKFEVAVQWRVALEAWFHHEDRAQREDETFPRCWLGIRADVGDYGTDNIVVLGVFDDPMELVAMARGIVNLNKKR